MYVAGYRLLLVAVIAEEQRGVLMRAVGLVRLCVLSFCFVRKRWLARPLCTRVHYVQYVASREDSGDEKHPLSSGRGTGSNTPTHTTDKSQRVANSKK
jgi:hypothetical protein